jgi:hypothetical protein
MDARARGWTHQRAGVRGCRGAINEISMDARARGWTHQRAGVRGCRGVVADAVAGVARVRRLRRCGSTGEPVPPLVRTGKRPWLPV